MRYEDALQQLLESVRAGEDPEVALERFPEHAAALRDDMRLTSALAALATAVPAPPAMAREAASSRLLAELAATRPEQKPRWRPWSLSPARYVLAAAVLALAVVGGGLLLDGGGASVEASTIEGVVVENESGRLTVQTLDALESVEVPAGAPISDVAGASILLGGIEAGQVVVVDVHRRGDAVIAQRVQRYVDSIEDWCTDESARCRLVSDGLREVHERCLQTPAACIVRLDGLESLRLRAEDSVALEELKQQCRGGDGEACRRIVRFCREHPVLCSLVPGDAPSIDRPSLQNRLETLNHDCLQGNDSACRQLAEACNRLPAACPPDTAPSPNVPPRTDVRPAPISTSTPDGPSDARPNLAATTEPEAEATSIPPRDVERAPASEDEPSSESATPPASRPHADPSPEQHVGSGDDQGSDSGARPGR